MPLASHVHQWQGKLMLDTDLSTDIEWIISDQPVDYPTALDWMETRAAAVADGTAREAVWLLEHTPLYTAGTSANVTELLSPDLPVFRAGRGGRYTYHGPGQRIAYIILDLSKRGRDIRCFVHALEGLIIDTLAQLGIKGRREAGRIGIWTDDPSIGEAKVAAIGVRVRRWVTFHGCAINIAPNLAHFSGIVPCGIAEFGVTSVEKLGGNISMTSCDDAFKSSFPDFLNALSNKQCA